MSKHQTIVISGFNGIGKSYLYDNGWDVLDIDSKGYEWLTDEKGIMKRNPEFPENFIKGIKDNMGKVEYIFVPSNIEVRDALKENHISYYNIYPDYNLKHEYIKRYEDRGNTETFIRLMDKKYRGLVKSMHDDVNLNKVILKKEGMYLEDALDSIEEVNHL